MGEYSVGIATRNKIYDAAKCLFYERGVAETSFKDIAAAAEVNKGLISYHFKLKTNLAELVFQDLIDSMAGAVYSHWENEGLDQSALDTIIELMEFRLIAENENICRFYDEVISDTFTERHGYSSSQLQIMRQYASDFGTSITEEALDTVVAMVNGTERELVHLVRLKRNRESVEAMVRRDMLCCLYLLGASGPEVERVVDGAIAVAEGFTMTCDASFTCKVVPR